MNKIGILGCGWIAQKMVRTIKGMQGYECVAAAARSKEKAENFAAEHGIARAYGSYEELVNDPDVQLIYIATPHSHHYRHALLAVNAGKPTLVEKAFCANATEAERLIGAARAKGVFVAEAIWTRYMPLMHRIVELAQSGIIGTATTITANLCYHMTHKERILKPELAGGALLDIGLYPLNFTAMVFGSCPQQTIGTCQKTHTGVDAAESITQFYDGNRMAVMTSSIFSRSDRMASVSGDKGYIVVDNVNCPTHVSVYDNDDRLIEEHFAEPNRTGYEYQLEACFAAIAEGKTEPDCMPHAETLRMMRLMDDLRHDWGVVYPNDKMVE